MYSCSHIRLFHDNILSYLCSIDSMFVYLRLYFCEPFFACCCSELPACAGKIVRISIDRAWSFQCFYMIAGSVRSIIYRHNSWCCGHGWNSSTMMSHTGDNHVVAYRRSEIYRPKLFWTNTPFESVRFIAVGSQLFSVWPMWDVLLNSTNFSTDVPGMFSIWSYPLSCCGVLSPLFDLEDSAACELQLFLLNFTTMTISRTSRSVPTPALVTMMMLIFLSKKRFVPMTAIRADLINWQTMYQ